MVLLDFGYARVCIGSVFSVALLLQCCTLYAYVAGSRSSRVSVVNGAAASSRVQNKEAPVQPAVIPCTSKQQRRSSVRSSVTTQVIGSAVVLLSSGMW